MGSDPSGVSVDVLSPMEGVPRKPREEQAGGLFHVYARGNERADIYRDADDRELYRMLLASTVVRQGWLCLCYCLMPNHVHLLVETPKPNLGRGMQHLHSRYAQTFNARHSRDGHLFQGRYGAVAVTDDDQLATTVSYIATNPVNAGLADEPEAWSWGSHGSLVRGQAPPWLAGRRLRALLAGAFGGDGAERYRELVAARLSAAAPEPSPSPA